MINIKKFLKDNSEFDYANFNHKFITTQYNILGVRLPQLKKFAKEIEPDYIDLDQNLAHEEILLYGFAAAQFKTEDEQLEYLQNIIPFIDNWATCDCIVCALKKLTGEKTYAYFCKLLDDEKEFFVRVGLVGMMRYFLKTDKLDDLLKRIENIKQTGYYVKMAIAWLYAELCISNFEKAKLQIEKTSDKFVRNRAISKAKESFRVDKPHKAELEKLRIK